MHGSRVTVGSDGSLVHYITLLNEVLLFLIVYIYSSPIRPGLSYWVYRLQYVASSAPYPASPPPPKKKLPVFSMIARSKIIEYSSLDNPDSALGPLHAPRCLPLHSPCLTNPCQHVCHYRTKPCGSGSLTVLDV